MGVGCVENNGTSVIRSRSSVLGGRVPVADPGSHTLRAHGSGNTCAAPRPAMAQAEGGWLPLR